MRSMRRVAVLLAALAAGSAVAAPTRVDVSVAPRPYGSYLLAVVTVEYDGPACPASGPLPPPVGTANLLVNGAVHQAGIGFFQQIYRQCVAGRYTNTAHGYVYGPEFGRYRIAAEFSGGNGVEPAVSGSVDVEVTPTLVGVVPGGTLAVGVAEPGFNPGFGWSCSARDTQLTADAGLRPPAGLSFPYGYVRARLQSCFYNCGFLCPAGVRGSHINQRILVEYPGPVPPNARLYAYRPDAPVPAWEPLATTVNGNRATAVFTAGRPYSFENRDLDATIGLAIDSRLAEQRDVEALWWAGAAENGWGASIHQLGDRLFTAIYVYDGAGNPTWYVMPEGSWDPTHSVFSGPLYQPSGSWFGAYDPSRFVVRAPVGTARLAFTSAGEGVLDYDIAGARGRKAIQRQPIGVDVPPTRGRYGGLWWGGVSQNGWGLSLVQQGDMLFGVWFTYDASGSPVWLVMTGGNWNGPRFEGALYRTTGSPWVGTSYEPSRLNVIRVGSMAIDFASADAATLSYAVEGVTAQVVITRQAF